MHTISVIDSHTGGEPTRLIVSGGPDLGSGPLSQRLERFREAYDHIRSAAVCEPRGSDVVVGALLCAPHDPSCSAGVIFFNNVGYLGMCGHGTIGLVASLAHLGRIGTGVHRIETPVGIVESELHADGSVTVHNVPAYRSRKRVGVDVEGVGRVEGDVAWGGNWFFLVERHGQRLSLDNTGPLTAFASRVRHALEAAGITGDDGAPIDHVELFGPPADPANDSRSFVLCPGNAYDRSPCGTGTSAKLACLAADGKLEPGQTWRQESIIGSVFEASYRRGDTAGRILPSIRGRAHVNAQATLLLDESDPFIWGIR
ncbi:4-hydroxyproline epimerase [Noviherbaspirillum denitrificans]|uniref:4-hydroxyproline epimerase n=1 Tax=Noviherbaspirillum denitrificans TaxID=1968433 RepID=A0A254TK03_9BURK|nr:4-hydroxyproline epimerase [Noviherbaspirillum denitrificans]OWW22961.1 hydroxyproline-2-epimerase [Noviherbaspirillum denitrificans]